MNNKKIFIVRHANAESEFLLNKTDFERNITSRGELEIIQTAKRLFQKFGKPDLIISSNALRAKETAHLLANHLGYDVLDIVFNEALYLCRPIVFDNQIANIIAEDLGYILIIGHNDGLTDYVNSKIDGFHIDNVPTASIVGFELLLNNWKDNNDQLKGQFLYFDRPAI